MLFLIWSGNPLWVLSFNYRVRTHHWTTSESSSSHTFTILFFSTPFYISASIVYICISHVISTHGIYTKEQQAGTVKVAISGISGTKEFQDTVIFQILENGIEYIPLFTYKPHAQT